MAQPRRHTSGRGAESRSWHELPSSRVAVTPHSCRSRRYGPVRQPVSTEQAGSRRWQADSDRSGRLPGAGRLQARMPAAWTPRRDPEAERSGTERIASQGQPPYHREARTGLEAVLQRHRQGHGLSAQEETRAAEMWQARDCAVSGH
jgi:hypothetical protein